MQIKTQYSFTVPRNDKGGPDFNTIARDLLDAGAGPGAFLGILGDMAQLDELAGLDPDEAKKDAPLVLGVGLKFGTVDILGNPPACAELADQYFNKQWSEVSGRVDDLPEEGARLFRGLIASWQPKTETVSMPSGAALTA